MLENLEFTRDYMSVEPHDLPHFYDVSIWVHRTLTVTAVTSLPLPSCMDRRALVVDVVLSTGAVVRVQTTHLESKKPNWELRAKQLEVLLPIVKAPTIPAIVVGDFNFCSSWPEENEVIEQDLRVIDVWPALRGETAGFTEDSVVNSMMLKAKRGKHKQVRFDRILLVNPDGVAPTTVLIPASIKLLGTTPLAGKAGIFPSDHFGLVATFKVMLGSSGGGGSELVACRAASDAYSECAAGPSVANGCDLFEEVLSHTEEDALIVWVDAQLVLGRANKLFGRTYTAPPQKWESRNQSREMLQYGAFTHANRVQVVPLEPTLPPELQAVVDTLVARGVFQPEQRPMACTVNVYEIGQYLPPHVDAVAFARPFATVSLESEHHVHLGDDLAGECGQWTGGMRVLMPRRSALRLDGDAAGPTVNHALAAHPTRRISLTFRRLSAEAVEDFACDAAESAARSRERQLAKRAAKKEKRARKAESKQTPTQ
jgi:alkylated DNA repair dioxygenase AlkB